MPQMIESMLSFGDLSELFVEYVKRSEPYSMADDHYHDYYEIYYMLSGKRIYFIRDRSYTVEQGDLVFIAKNEVHKTMLADAAAAAHERVIIHLNDHFIQRYSDGHDRLLLTPFDNDIHVLRLPRSEQLIIDQLIRRMLHEIQQKPAGYSLYPRAAVTELLLHSARYLLHNEPAPLHHTTPIHAKISEIVRYINNHFAESIRLSMLAEQFYISSFHLSRTFKEITGFAFSDYVTITRIKEAQRLLRETDMPITGVASSVGFDNFSHFGKTFKRITRVSPRDYRKQI